MAEKHLVVSDEIHKQLRLLCIRKGFKLVDATESAILLYLMSHRVNGKKAVRK